MKSAKKNIRKCFPTRTHLLHYCRNTATHISFGPHTGPCCRWDGITSYRLVHPIVMRMTFGSSSTCCRGMFGSGQPFGSVSVGLHVCARVCVCVCVRARVRGCVGVWCVCVDIVVLKSITCYCAYMRRSNASCGFGSFLSSAFFLPPLLPPSLSLSLSLSPFHSFSYIG
jgi:hypothetical protein